jgi:GntR family transcriptional regulator, transcriptional repressor for pyruvate dehydrogenase complex
MAEIKELIVPPRKETLSANIAAQIKSLIFKKKIREGDKLPPERELAKMFDVSRVVVKQALLALEHSGFIRVELGANGGAVVTQDFIKPIRVCMEDLQKNGGTSITHFQDVRVALERAALQATMAKVNEEDLERLAEINREFGARQNRHRHAELNGAFHLSLAEISGNPLIKILLLSLLEVAFTYTGPSISAPFIKKAYQDHEKIIAALRERDLARAESLLVSNIDMIRMDDL